MCLSIGLKGGNEALKEQKAANALTVKDVDEAMTEAQDLISQTVSPAWTEEGSWMGSLMLIDLCVFSL